MKHLFKRAAALLLAVIMLCSIGVVGAFALTGTSADSDSTCYKGAFYYRPAAGEYEDDSDNEDYYVYSDDYFKKSGKIYDPHLCTMSYTVAISSSSSTREPFTDEGYARKNRNVKAILEDIGFSDIVVNDDYTVKPTKDSAGVCCAHKKIVQDGREYTLLAIVPRSAGYEAEWGDNFVIGAKGNAEGFDRSAEQYLAFAKDYIAAQDISGDVKVWTVGYSRGATIANLAAAKLIDDPAGYLGEAVTLAPEDLYVYTCSTPQGADINNDPHNEKYAGIFSRYLDTDMASMMAPEAMGFTRYGVCDPTFDLLYKEESYDKMTEYLGVINDDVHDTYEDSVNSKFFHPKKLAVADGSVVISNDDSSYIPCDPAEYLQGLGAYLTEITGGREEYARIYEQPLSDLIAYYMSLSGEESAAMTAALIDDDDLLNLVVALYAYFMNTKSDSKKKDSPDRLREKAVELAAIAAGADGEYASTGIDAGMIAEASVKLGVYLLMSADSVKRIAADYLSSILKDAMQASGATKEEIANLTGQKACLALTHFISHMLFGNIWQSSEVRPLTLNNEQMKAAATLIGNAANLVIDHVNEVVISWLKTEDSYYADFGPFEGSQAYGYRRVYVDTADGSAFNGYVKDDNGAVVAQIENGTVKNSADQWVGFTPTDSGGFFRVPADRDYSVSLNTVKADTVSVGVGEYEVYDAETNMMLDTRVTVKATDTVIVSLPALEEGDEGYVMPSDTAYSVTVAPATESDILGDVDMNGEVDIIDATWLQRHIAGFIILSDAALALSDVDGDGEITVMDVSAIQRYTGNLSAPEGIGKPKAVPS